MPCKLNLTGLTPEAALPKLASLPSDEERADVILLFGIAFVSPEIEALSRRITGIRANVEASTIGLTPRLRELYAVLADFDEGKRRRAEARPRRPKPKRIVLIERPWWADGEFNSGSHEKPSA